jgi:hypothetical protein
VRKEPLAPLVVAGELPHGSLARLDFQRVGRLQQPVTQARVASGRRRRPKPLGERCTPEKIEIDGVRVVRQIDPRRRHGRRQAAPISADSGFGCLVDEAQRLEPLDPFFDACVPDDERAKAKKQDGRHREEKNRRANSQHPGDASCRGQEREQPESRNSNGAAALHIRGGAVRGSPVPVRRSHAHGNQCTVHLRSGFVKER